LTDRKPALAATSPTVVLISVPFPGAVYAAFRIAQTIKQATRHITTVLGGGYVNTELRELTEPRVFDYFDFVTLDAGERPLLALLEHLQGKRSRPAPGAHLRARGDGRRPLHQLGRARRAVRRTSAPPPGTACRWTAT
jgi:hypothetical protein